jgi:hypothetical protein
VTTYTSSSSSFSSVPDGMCGLMRPALTNFSSARTSTASSMTAVLERDRPRVAERRVETQIAAAERADEGTENAQADRGVDLAGFLPVDIDPRARIGAPSAPPRRRPSRDPAPCRAASNPSLPGA